jgi:hypothetical protein
LTLILRTSTLGSLNPVGSDSVAVERGEWAAAGVPLITQDDEHLLRVEVRRLMSDLQINGSQSAKSAYSVMVRAGRKIFVVNPQPRAPR